MCSARRRRTSATPLSLFLALSRARALCRARARACVLSVCTSASYFRSLVRPTTYASLRVRRVKHWRPLLRWCRRTAPTLLFEDNGNREQQTEHQALLRLLYPRIDDLGCRVRGRRLLLCRAE